MPTMLKYIRKYSFLLDDIVEHGLFIEIEYRFKRLILLKLILSFIYQFFIGNTVVVGYGMNLIEKSFFCLRSCLFSKDSAHPVYEILPFPLSDFFRGFGRKIFGLFKIELVDHSQPHGKKYYYKISADIVQSVSINSLSMDAMNITNKLQRYAKLNPTCQLRLISLWPPNSGLCEQCAQLSKPAQMYSKTYLLYILIHAALLLRASKPPA